MAMVNKSRYQYDGGQGKRLKEARQAMGWSQSDLGKMLGMQASGVSKLESGTSTMRESHFMLLEKAGISAEWLKTGQGKMLLLDESPEQESSDVNIETAGIMRAFSRLTPEEKRAVAPFFRKVTEGMENLK